MMDKDMQKMDGNRICITLEGEIADALGAIELGEPFECVVRGVREEGQEGRFMGKVQSLEYDGMEYELAEEVEPEHEKEMDEPEADETEEPPKSSVGIVIVGPRGKGAKGQGKGKPK